MKKAVAWKGFYNTVKEIERLEKMSLTERVKEGHGRSYLKGLYLLASRYGKSLVLEHKWEDKWTHTYANHSL